MVTTTEVINLVLEKYKVDSSPGNFSLFIVRDNGEQKRLKDDEYPLITRVTLGPHEDVARIFLVDSRKTDEIRQVITLLFNRSLLTFLLHRCSNEVAQFLNLSLPECRAILERYDQELAREVAKIKERWVLKNNFTSQDFALKELFFYRYAELRRRIVSRMESLKVHL